MIKRFCEEAIEQLREMTSGVLALERGDRVEERLSAVRRSLHSLKGSCRLLGLLDAATVLHKLEDVLGLIHGRDRTPAGEAVNTVLIALDSMQSFFVTLHDNDAVKSLEKIIASLDTLRYVLLDDRRSWVDRLVEKAPDVFGPLNVEQRDTLIRYGTEFAHIVLAELAFRQASFADDIRAVHEILTDGGVLVSTSGSLAPPAAGFHMRLRFLALTNVDTATIERRLRAFAPDIRVIHPPMDGPVESYGAPPADLEKLTFEQLQERYRERFGRIDWLSRKELISRLSAGGRAAPAADEDRSPRAPSKPPQASRPVTHAEGERTESRSDSGLPDHSTAAPENSAHGAERSLRSPFDYDREFTQLQNMFLSEAGKDVEALEAHLRSLAEYPNEAELTAVHRIFHNLKGSGGSYRYAYVSRIAALLEGYLQQYRQNAASVTPETVAKFRHGVDSLRQVLRWAERGEHDRIPIAEMERDIEQTFVVPVVPSGPPLPSPVPTTAAPERLEPRTAESLRVDLHKLDRIVNTAVELSVANHTETYLLTNFNELLHQLHELTARWSSMRDLIETAPSRDTTVLHDTVADYSNLLQSFSKKVGDISRAVESNLTLWTSLSKSLSSEVLQLHLQPLSLLFGIGERAVRDLSITLGKKAQFESDGGDVEVDRWIIDALKDSLIHLLRNAVDHGLETPERRRSLGKPEFGSVRIAARQIGFSFVLTISDDGQGIDRMQIMRTAIERGLATESSLRALSDAEIFRYLFIPGFSTRRIATDISGRGVGLDVVASTLRQLGGEITVQSVPGKSTTFQLLLPTTLRLSRMLLIEVGGSLFTFPVANCEKVMMLPEGAVRVVGERPMVPYEDALIPVVELETLMQMPRVEKRLRNGLVVRHEDEFVCLSVPVVVDELELMSKPLPDHLQRNELISGANILPDGRIGLVVNMRAVIDAMQKGTPTAPAEEPMRPPTVLVVDDSMLARELFRNILQSAGFEVALVNGGEDALRYLSSHRVDLVLTDLEMPVMNGIELTRTIKSDPASRMIPVIAVTAYDDLDRQRRGREAGADALLLKGTFNQDNLIATMKHLLDRAA